MEPGAEAVTLGTFMGWGVLLVLIAGIATPIVLWVGEANAAVVVRLAGALFAAAVVFRLIAAVRAVPDGTALRRKQAAGEPDPRLARLAGEVRLSLRQRGYFARVLWPHLEKIARRRHAQLPRDMPPRHGRPVSRDDLERILAAIEAAE